MKIPAWRGGYQGVHDGWEWYVNGVDGYVVHDTSSDS